MRTVLLHYVRAPFVPKAILFLHHLHYWRLQHCLNQEEDSTALEELALMSRACLTGVISNPSRVTKVIAKSCQVNGVNALPASEVGSTRGCNSVNRRGLCQALNCLRMFASTCDTPGGAGSDGTSREWGSISSWRACGENEVGCTVHRLISHFCHFVTATQREMLAMHMSSHAVLRTGMVMDFRGPPVIPLGVLSSSAADMTGVQERCDI